MLEQLVPDVRVLTAEEIGVGVHAAADASHASSSPDTPEISYDHPLIQEIARLAAISGGVILSGPPGTSKSFFAAHAAEYIAEGEKGRIRFVQFHASYQYEDFMLGFAPKAAGGFAYKKGPFLDLIERAVENPAQTFVLVIDELSRADVGRVFGEALTYVERSKRELEFTIADGASVRVPSNFVIIATMNPFDRGVDEVDAAFERRFAKISMDPDRNILDEILTDNGMEVALKDRLLSWFSRMNSLAARNAAAAVGHAYFNSAHDALSLADIWQYQLKYLVHRAFRRDPNTRAEIEAAWDLIFETRSSSSEPHPVAEGSAPESQ